MCEEHDGYPFERSAEVQLILKKNISPHGASQQFLCCGAAIPEMHNNGHFSLKFEAK
jgi:hypothetical protein